MAVQLHFKEDWRLGAKYCPLLARPISAEGMISRFDYELTLAFHQGTAFTSGEKSVGVMDWKVESA